MSPSRAQLATVRTAQRRGPDRPSEDRILTLPDAVVVLDGASEPDPSEHDGGWLADTLGHQLIEQLASASDDLAEALAESIAIVAARYGLRPGSSPSTTVSIVRWDEDAVDVLVLGDSPVIAATYAEDVFQVRDDRLRQVATAQRTANASVGFGAGDRDGWRRLVAQERAYRNRDGGYWIAEAVPDAAHHAERARWRRDELAAVLAMTDGVSAGVDRYRAPQDWMTAVTIARDDPRRLIDLVHDTEKDDPDGVRWPRSKRHDDKALAVIDFAGPPVSLRRSTS
ncbi:protein phosphatase 2C domain-containing protein [Couchioplanes azureus]|uniref:protein phosphatase 2C domain-containing protein n=1 Tax=Couchioplanes caeruleus TaxID=56438 RepID=UPI001670E4B4|nr:protein phosphatase 2C domain-containing protein [Couchioplanes caeruleus]GGQ70233.1 hypothetical protein GCM10010166_45120 [Couchioplanes caeruleus subsp. azureus]